jgi:hypothetical protein
LASDTARDALANLLGPLLPDSWVVAPYARTIERIDKTVVMLHATEIRPAPAAPGSSVEVDYVVSVTSPKTDETVAQTALDDDVTTLCLALGSTSWVIFRNATPTTVSSYFAWDVNITVISRKDA